jgi:hypothetical protein
MYVRAEASARSHVPIQLSRLYRRVLLLLRLERVWVRAVDRSCLRHSIHGTIPPS